ncbi:MAG: hypothetical protein Q8S18_01480 [Bacteroidales bacterium]|nr:hypothetical protein [Bacteroidales bacterium]
MMLNVDYKKKLIHHCIQLQQDSYQVILTSMNESQAEANAYGPPKDRYDGFRNQQLRKGQLFEKQAGQVLQNLKALNIIGETSLSKVDFGALVETDRMLFFISIGIGLIDFEGKKVAVISTQVPIYKVMHALKSDDKFSFAGNTHTIISII